MATHGHAKSTHTLTKVKFNTIVEEAQKFVKQTCGCGKSTQLTEVINVDQDDEWACLIDNLDSEPEECKLVFPSVSAVSCGKKVITSRISGPDKYRWVVLVVHWGVFSPIVGS
jgi:hypothetical protein